MTYTHRMSALPAQYDTAAIEKKWQAHWLAARTYAWNPNVARADSYVIDTPPPTVSGTLHMGHVFSYTQADFIARFQRMNGKNVFYPMGFDDNGLPTERLVEKTKKIRATDMSREAFIAECMSVSEEARAEFRTLFQSIALSVDWDQEYHTISDASRRLSQLSFLDLVNKGEVYRKQQPMLWDPVDQTAIAQAEIEDKMLPSHFTDIVFACAENNEELVIGTTRPELLPACVALFYHPEDTRYQHLADKHATVPLFGFSVPILTDASVEPEKGTGLMMCCTFGDEKDIEKWRTHNLPTRVVINKFGKMDFSQIHPPAGAGSHGVHPHPPAGAGSHGVHPHPPAGAGSHGVHPHPPAGAGSHGVHPHPPAGAGSHGVHPHPPAGAGPSLSLSEGEGRGEGDFYALLQGKKVSNTDPKHLGARETVLALLKEAGLIRKQEAITHAVKCAERSGAALELIPTAQWFVKVTDKKEALKARADSCNWNPEWMKLRIHQWIDGLNWDWCISRQRYFGVPFPVWYSLREGEMGKAIYASPEQLPCNPLVDLPAGYSREEVTADADVMDTWATSSISPQLSAGAINTDHRIIGSSDHRFEKLFPADLRPQAHEIIRTWAFYTIVKAHLHNDSVPWHNLMISGWCLAEDKSKMSKSKGNVVTPVALIEERGTDAVRYWAGTSRLGQDTAFSPDLLKIGKKLVGKLWNATAFAAIHLSKMDSAPTTAATDAAITETLDRWILSRLNETIAKATDAFTRYEYADALDATNQFFWADFCDNYLELIKKRVYNEPTPSPLRGEGWGGGEPSPTHPHPSLRADLPPQGGGAFPFSAAAQQSAVRTLYYVLDGILKLYAPFTPHVTEELYSHIFADRYAAKGSLHANGQWPKAEDYPMDGTALEAGKLALVLLEVVRKHKSDAQRSIKTPVTFAKFRVPKDQFTLATAVEADLKGAGNILEIEWQVLDSNVGYYELTLAPEADAA